MDRKVVVGGPAHRRGKLSARMKDGRMVITLRSDRAVDRSVSLRPKEAHELGWGLLCLLVQDGEGLGSDRLDRVRSVLGQ
jgi:hypothetical protein